MNNAIQTQLIPVVELAPGAISRIRNEAIAKVVSLASRELNKSPEELIVRDIRPYSDIYWCTHDDAIDGTVATTETWIADKFDDSAILGDYVATIAASHTTMADSRYVCIYGVKDIRMCLATKIEKTISLIKVSVGGNDRVIWDVQNIEGYPNAMAGVCPSPIVIPQNTDYQIYVYGGLSVATGGTDLYGYIILEGFVVEPRGKVLSP